ncbi:MAG TPA: ABC transporter permease [Candidatus Saccharimonadales bacterium]|nr:ABC transporter permease [Candidatus Saccharimonadales bacterium]
MNWPKRIFLRKRIYDDLSQEIREHLEEKIEELVASGMCRKEASHAAHREFGNVTLTEEDSRTVWRWPSIESFFMDVSYALRTLRKDRRFTFIAILALALGIGASTVVFSVVYSVFFHALPYKDFNRSVVINMNNLGSAGGWKVRQYFFPEEVRAFREQSHIFEEIVAYIGMRPKYDDGKSIRFFSFGAVVTPNTFDYLGVPPLLGRTISEEDGRPGAPPVFVMNYRLWQREFGGDPKILGTTFILNGKPTTLVGIMPLQFNAFGANFWMPVTPDYATHGFKLMGRLKPGVSAQTAGVELDAIAHRLHRPNPGGIFPEDKFTIVPQALLDSLIGNFRTTLYVLFAAVLLLLLIACSNVANLLLARATAREREIAVRATLGATRGRLVRQLLVESFLLAAAATGAGCVLAYFGLEVVIALIPAGTLPVETVIRMNAPVFLLSLALTILTTILCGLAPALHVARGQLQPRLTGSGKGVGESFQHSKLRGGLVVSEVALSIVLLIGAGLLMRSFLILTRVDLGFDPKNILYFELNLPPTYNTDLADSLQRKNALTRQLLERMRALPAVTAVAEMADPPPLKYEVTDTIIPGKPHSSRWETRFEMCSDGYFQTLGVPLFRGRFFSQDDVSAARDVMVVNEAFSRQYFPSEDPLGHKVKLDIFDKPYFAGAAPHDTYFEIIGIVGDYKTRSYDNPSWQSFPQAFVPYSVAGFNWRLFMARTSVDPSLLLKNMGQEVRALDPGVQISTSGTLEGSLQEFYREPQFQFATLSAFAGIGLVLVMIGIFSVMAYAVSLRTNEIGVRMALGAQQSDILHLMLLNGFRLVAGGILVGLLFSSALTRLLTSQIPGVSATDPWTFSGVVAVVLFVGIAACLAPARRAMKVDPMVALRYE